MPDKSIEGGGIEMRYDEGEELGLLYWILSVVINLKECLSQIEIRAHLHYYKLMCVPVSKSISVYGVHLYLHLCISHWE